VIPARINRDHVLTALSLIERDGVPPGRESRGVELRHNGRGYPPKLVISVACQVATGRELPSSEFITTDAERYLSGLRFSVARTGQQPLAAKTEGARSATRGMVKDDGLTQEIESLARELLYSARLYRWSELKKNPILPPPSPGVYGWFFRRMPPEVPTDLCVAREGAILLYVGISPKNDASDGSLRKRLQLHFEGNAESSTFRETLGCLLEPELGTALRRDGSGNKTFGEKESTLSDWIADNTMVAWVTTPKPWLLEDHLLNTLSLPLNIEGNAGHSFSARLKELRKKAVQRVEGLDIVPRRNSLFLVSCVSEKHDRPMPARVLYCSLWFQKARAFVEGQGARWFILSAKYGLVAPDQVIDPYDETLNEKSVEERQKWSKKVVQELRLHCTPGTSIVLLAGEKYRQFLLPGLRELGCSVEVPMEGLGIGEQLHWLTAQHSAPYGPEQSRPAPPTVVSELSSPEVDADAWLKNGLGGLEVDQEIRKPAEEALRFADLSPEASIRSARAALIAVVKKMGARDAPNFLDQAIRDLEDGGQISEITAHEMRTIQKIRNAVEYRNRKVTTHDARTCAFVLIAILKAVGRGKNN
jgi:Domain of unknown function (DUF4145)